MLNLIISIISGIIFFICVGSFILQVVFALRFRNANAVPRGYTEGSLAGADYPMLIISISLLFVQFVMFIAFPITHEFFSVIRIVLYLLTVVSFAFFRARTPDILAYWFGKDHIYESNKSTGVFTYDRITSIYCTPRKVHPRQYCRVIFTVYGKKFLGHRKKYVCRMTGRDYAAIFNKRRRVYSADLELPETRLHKFCTGFLPALYLILAVSIVFLSIGTGIFSPYFYETSDSPISGEIHTLTSVSDVALAENTDTLFVLYDRIGVINAYTSDGEYKYSLSVPIAFSSHAHINIIETAETDAPFSSSIVSGKLYLLYRIGTQAFVFDSENGENVWKGEYSGELVKNGAYVMGDRNYSFDKFSVFYTSGGETFTVYDTPSYFSVFDPLGYWIVFSVCIVLIFVLRFLIRPLSEVDGDDEDLIYDDDELDNYNGADDSEEDIITGNFDEENVEEEDVPDKKALRSAERARKKAEKKARKLKKTK